MGPSSEMTTYATNGFLAFDIVHAVEFSRIGRSYYSTSRLRFRATALTYHQPDCCQNDRPRIRRFKAALAGGFFILNQRNLAYKIETCWLDLVPLEAGKLCGFSAPLG